jgi:hypothetical protein
MINPTPVYELPNYISREVSNSPSQSESKNWLPYIAIGGTILIAAIVLLIVLKKTKQIHPDTVATQF